MELIKIHEYSLEQREEVAPLQQVASGVCLMRQRRENLGLGDNLLSMVSSALWEFQIQEARYLSNEGESIRGIWVTVNYKHFKFTDLGAVWGAGELVSYEP